MSIRSRRPARTRPSPASIGVPGALLAALVAAPLVAGEIYRTTQSDGTVVFTDRPEPDATLVESRPLNVVGADPAPVALAPPVRAADPMAGVPIERVEIASPPPDVTIIDPAGPLLVEIGTAPGSLAASGYVAEALLDGEVVATGTSSMIAVPAPERGAHRLGIRLVDADGDVVVESAGQFLYVQRSIDRSSPDEAR